MKYPYIGKAPINDGAECKEFDFCMFYKPSFGVALESNANHECGYKSNNWCESGVFINITHEYLQNTYGEVVSPEHAELIIELAENASADISTSWEKGKFFNFYTSSSGALHLDFFDEHLAKDSNEKQITIPLPPESERGSNNSENPNSSVSKVNRDIERSKQSTTLTTEEETELKSRAMASDLDRQGKIFKCPNSEKAPKHIYCMCDKCGGKCCTGQCDKQEPIEWPQVGDEVVAVHECNSLKGKLLALTKKYAIISQGSEEQHLHLSAWTLQKPKTPEEELRDDIQSIIFKKHAEMATSIHVKNSLVAMSNSATEILLDEFEIKRKPH